MAKELHVQRWLSETKSSRLPKGLERGGEAWFGSVFSKREEVSFGLPDHSESVFLFHGLLHGGHPCLPLFPGSYSPISFLCPFDSHLLEDGKGRETVERGAQRTEGAPDSAWHPVPGTQRVLIQGERKQTGSISLLLQGLWGRQAPRESALGSPPRPSSGQNRPRASGSELPGFLLSVMALVLSVAPCHPLGPSHMSPDACALGTGVEGRTPREGEAALKPHRRTRGKV